MKVFPIRDPLAGEQVVGVDPEPARQVDAGWRRRLNLFTGRSLTHSALIAEQQQRAGRLAMLGRAVSAGVVSGLEVALESGGNGVSESIHLAPGLGITAAGEEVLIGRALRVPVRELRVFGWPALGEGVEVDLEAEFSDHVSGGLGPTLGALLDAGATSPDAGFLVLQPVVGERIGDFDAGDPCPRDPQSEAFEDQQLVDGTRLFLYLWPRERLPMPARGPRWRNRLAYAVFERERGLSAGQRMPWEEVGLAVALAGFAAGGAIGFLDRHSVVRAGGEPRARGSVAAGAGSRFLHTARVQQFAEELSDLIDSGVAVTAARDHFRKLPPVGLLPVEFLDLSGFRQRFLPRHFTVAALPAPAGQLEEVLLESAALEPFDVAPAGERPMVEMLIGVPQELYEPRLLHTEVVDPEFQQTIDAFVEQRAEALARRTDLRAKNDLLQKAITGEQATYPEDSDAEPGEQAATGPLSPAEADYGTVEADDGSRRATAFESLRGFLTSNATLSRELAAGGNGNGDRLDELGIERFIKHLEDRIQRADDKIDVGFLRVQTDIYRIRQLMLGSEASARLATSPILASIAKAESAYASRKDLEEFVQKIRRAPTSSEPSGGSTPSSPAGAGGSAPAGGSPTVTRAAGGGAATEVRASSAGSSALTRGGANPRGDLFVDGGFGEVGLVGAARGGLGPVDVEASLGEVSLGASREDVLGQSAIVGQTYDFRTLTIGERLQQPPANEAKSATVSSKFQIVSGFLDPDLNEMVSDLSVPGFLTEGEEATRTFDQIRTDSLQDEIIAGAHDPDPTDADEAHFFSAAVRAADHSVAILRRVEGRVASYRRGVARCREALAATRRSAAALASRLVVVDKRLAEARHDVAVARALLAEETARIGSINDRRALVLREHTEVLAFRRPRFTRPLRAVPSRPLDPAAVEEAVPSCLDRPGEVPEEIRAMVELFREAPLRWHRRSGKLLERLDRLEVMRETLRGARKRAAVRALPSLPPRTSTAPGRGRFGGAVHTVLSTHQQVLATHRLATSRIDLTRVARESWKESRRRAFEVLSLGDLMDLGHGRADVARRSAAELEDMAKVATCLYAGFGEVLPAIRLDWAEQLSQFDSPVDLRDLTNLPRWEEIGIRDRQHLQQLADWLFERVERSEKEAVALMSDLVRLCLLLASHAPVGRILTGTVAEATTVRPGGRVPLTVVDPASVRVGMQVLLFSGATTVARGVVEDLSGGRAVARMVHAFQENARIDKDSRVQFAEARAFRLTGVARAQ